MRAWARGAVVGVVATAALALPARAQTVYRCGPDGRSYSQQPCADGKPVRVGDVRSEADRREAESTAERDARVVRKLERERLAIKPASTGAIGIDSRGGSAIDPTKPAASKKRRKSSANDAEFRAAVPRPAKTKAASTNG